MKAYAELMNPNLGEVIITTIHMQQKQNIMA